MSYLILLFLPVRHGAFYSIQTHSVLLFFRSGTSLPLNFLKPNWVILHHRYGDQSLNDEMFWYKLPSTDICCHNWLPRDFNMRPITSISDNPPQWVSQLILPSEASWNREKIMETFITIDVDRILSIPLCTRQMDDFCSWNFEKKGIFIFR